MEAFTDTLPIVCNGFKYMIVNVGKTASMSMLTLFESRYTLNQRYSIGNVGKTASICMLTLFESRYTYS